jgi:hypothetical protein
LDNTNNLEIDSFKIAVSEHILKITIFSTPRPLFDGIMFLTACDVDFILKCE